MFLVDKRKNLANLEFCSLWNYPSKVKRNKDILKQTTKKNLSEFVARRPALTLQTLKEALQKKIQKLQSTLKRKSIKERISKSIIKAFIFLILNWSDRKQLVQNSTSNNVSIIYLHVYIYIYLKWKKAMVQRTRERN